MWEQMEREREKTTLKSFCNLWGANLLRIDFSSALDKISHEVLVYKMEKCGLADRVGGGSEGYTTMSRIFFSCSTLFLLIKSLGWKEP